MVVYPLARRCKELLSCLNGSMAGSFANQYLRPHGEVGGLAGSCGHGTDGTALTGKERTLCTVIVATVRMITAAYFIRVLHQELS